MNRHEFLRRLEDALTGEVSPQVTASNLQYYEEYILDEIRKGRTEEEVLGELGDPRLIARTIFDSQEAAAGSYGEERYTYEEPDGSSGRQSYENWGGQSSSGFDEMQPGLWERIRPTVIIAGVVIAGLAVLSALFSLALHILLSPLFWVLLAGWGLWRVFFR